MRDSRVMDLAFGGLYASMNIETGKVSLFRLLDFNVDAIHVTMYEQTFDAVPTAADVRALSPFIWHAPIDARTLLRDDDLELIGENPLSPEDLDGYLTYLEAIGMSEDERRTRVQELMAFSRKRGIRVRLRADGDRLVVEEP